MATPRKPKKHRITLEEAMSVLGRFASKARMKKTTFEQRQVIAKKAIKVRWDRHRAKIAEAAKAAQSAIQEKAS